MYPKGYEDINLEQIHMIIQFSDLISVKKRKKEINVTFKLAPFILMEKKLKLKKL